MHKAAFFFFKYGNPSPCKFEKGKSKIKGIFKFREKSTQYKIKLKKNIVSHAFENDILLIRAILNYLQEYQYLSLDMT